MHLQKKRMEYYIKDYPEAEMPMLANGLNFGQYVLLYDGGNKAARGFNEKSEEVFKDAKSLAENKNMPRNYIQVMLIKAKVVPQEKGSVLEVEGTGRIFSAVMVNEQDMRYEIPYLIETRKLTQKGEEVKSVQRRAFFDPNLREIKDIKFYESLVNLYRELIEEEKTSNRLSLLKKESADNLRDRDFLFEFADRFANSKNPFKKNTTLTMEQKDEVASFTEAVARKAYTNENFELEDDYYELMGLMENNLKVSKSK